MKYRLRLNEDPEIEAEVKYTQTIDGTTIIIDDIGEFDCPVKGIFVTKIELIGEDNEVYAMRKLPGHLGFNWTTSCTLSIHFRLTLGKELVQEKVE